MEAVNPDKYSVSNKLIFWIVKLTHSRVEEYLKKSLDSLQLSYVDLYLIHFPVGTEPITDLSQPLKTIPTDHIAIWKVSFKYIPTKP